MIRKRITRALSLLLACVFTIGVVCVNSNNEFILSAKASQPDQIYTDIEGNVRIQVLSQTLVRVEEKGPKGFEDRKSFHIVNRTDWAGDSVTKTEDDNYTYLSATKYNIRIKKNALKLSDVKIYNKQDALLWNFTGLPTNKVALPEANKEVNSFAIADTPRIIPSENGFNPQPDGATENVSTNGWDLNNNAADMFIFLPENNHRQLRTDFVSLTGKTDMLSLSSLGAWDSRYHPYSQQEALDQIDNYHNRNLPLDVLVVDTDWRDASNGMGYDINTNLFPNMSQFFEDSHSKNVQIIFNDHPEPTKTNGVQNNVIHPTEVAYRSKKLTDLLKMGLDGWWYDRNWSTALVPIQGFTHEVMGMAVFADAQKTAYPDKRLFMMSNIDGIMHGTITNPSNIAAHRYGVQWTGDTLYRQSTIFQEIYDTIERGEISALPYVSTDLGAHNTRTSTMTNTEYLRWVQMGALSPIFRLHVRDKDIGRMPWNKGEEATNIYRDYVNMRYRLLPVFYQLSNENYNTGLPMVRSMNFNYPQYKKADRRDQYMLGDDIMVAPVIDDVSEGIVPSSWLNNGTEQGLKADYFNNKNLSGNAVLTKTESQINFNWGTGAANSSVGNDNFSARYTGTIKPDKDVQIYVASDDGCRLFINDELVVDSWGPQGEEVRYASKKLSANQTYSIKIEYFEDAGDASCKLGYGVIQTESLQRSVWIPDGEWINASTGETFYGPQTVNVKSTTAQMPVFIRKGSVVPLADEMLTTKEKDWSHMTLDYYPSTRQNDTTTIYEDDTETTAYQNGKFRTTELTTGFSNGKATLKIGAAQGTFDGPRAFTTRNWTLRVHTPKGFGALQNVSDGTNNLQFTKVNKDTNAMPFAINGGSTDSDVYDIVFSSDVYTEKNITLEFANPTEDAIPTDITFDSLIANDNSVPNDVEVIKEITVTDKVPTSVNLTTEGTKDWYYTTYQIKNTNQPNSGDPIIKDADKALIHVTQPINKMVGDDFRARFSATDAKNNKNFTNSPSFSYGVSVGDRYDVTVKSSTQAQQLTLYIGAWSGTGKLEIFDDSDNSSVFSQIITASGSSAYRMVTIKFASEKTANLRIKYSKYEASGNITFAAATLKNLSENEFDIASIKVQNDIQKLPEATNITKNDYSSINAVFTAYSALSLTQKSLTSETLNNKLNNVISSFNKLFTVTSDNLPAGKTYNNSAKIELTAPVDADLYFTTDGTDPTNSTSAKSVTKGNTSYLDITKTTTVRAALNTGLGFSDIKQETYKITIPVTVIKIKNAPKTVTVGTQKQLSVTFSPSTATNKNVSFISSDKKIISVTSAGKIKAVGVGKATITVIAENGKVKYNVNIDSNPKAPTSFKLNKKGKTAKLKFKTGSGATHTQILMKKDKKSFTSIKTTNLTTYSKKLKPGKYTFKLRAHKKVKGKNYFSNYTVTKTVIIK